MIACNEYLIGMRQVAKPIHEIVSLGLRTGHGEITGMHYDIGLGKLCQVTM